MFTQFQKNHKQNTNVSCDEGKLQKLIVKIVVVILQVSVCWFYANKYWLYGQFAPRTKRDHFVPRMQERHNLKKREILDSGLLWCCRCYNLWTALDNFSVQWSKTCRINRLVGFPQFKNKPCEYFARALQKPPHICATIHNGNFYDKRLKEFSRKSAQFKFKLVV